MINHLALGLAVLFLGAASASAQTPGPAAPSALAAAPTPDCSAASGDRLTGLPRSLFRSLAPQEGSLPTEDNIALTMNGSIPVRDPSTPLTFRVFAFRYSDMNWRYATAVDTTQVEAKPATADGPQTYVIHFKEPAYSFSGVLRRDRTVYILACEGARVAAWSQDTGTFNSRTAAEVYAFLFVLLIWLATTIVVYISRVRAYRAEAAAQEAGASAYRLETVKPWTFWECLDPVRMTADMFDRGSLPKLQILFFVLLIIYSLALQVLWQGQLTEISRSVVFLLGIPALGTLGSQLASTSRERLSADNWAWLVARRVLPINDRGGGERPRWSDLIMSDGELDLYKLQALAFSVVVGASLLAAGPKGLNDFQVPDTLLQILGLSQLVMVGGRFAKPTTIADIDAMITELRQRETALQRAISTGVDVDESGKPQTIPAVKPATPPQDLDAAAVIAPTAVKRLRDLAAQVDVLLEAMVNRSIDGARLTSGALS